MFEGFLKWMPGFWAVLFLLVPILGVASFVFAPSYNIWLPRDVSEHGHHIDWLINITMVFLTILFVIMCIWMVIAVV